MERVRRVIRNIGRKGKGRFEERVTEGRREGRVESEGPEIGRKRRKRGEGEGEENGKQGECRGVIVMEGGGRDRGKRDWKDGDGKGEEEDMIKGQEEKGVIKEKVRGGER